METKKISLAAIKGKLTRTEMRHIMAGSTVTCYGYPNAYCDPGFPCPGGRKCHFDAGAFCCR